MDTWRAADSGVCLFLWAGDMFGFLLRIESSLEIGIKTKA
jgi:hypothetical protein